MAIRNNIVVEKTTKLVFLWPNMGQLCFNVLKKVDLLKVDMFQLGLSLRFLSPWNQYKYFFYHNGINFIPYIKF